MSPWPFKRRKLQFLPELFNSIHLKCTFQRAWANPDFSTYSQFLHFPFRVNLALAASFWVPWSFFAICILAIHARLHFQVKLCSSTEGIDYGKEKYSVADNSMVVSVYEKSLFVVQYHDMDLKQGSNSCCSGVRFYSTDPAEGDQGGSETARSCVCRTNMESSGLWWALHMFPTINVRRNDRQ